MIDPRLVIEPLKRGDGMKFAKVSVSLFVPRKQKQMVSLVLFAPGLYAQPIRRDVSLHADQRLDALLLALQVELHHAEHHAMVGDGERRLSERLGAGDQIRDAVGAVEQAVLGVVMNVAKAVEH